MPNEIGEINFVRDLSRSTKNRHWALIASFSEKKTRNSLWKDNSHEINSRTMICTTYLKWVVLWDGLRLQTIYDLHFSFCMFCGVSIFSCFFFANQSNFKRRTRITCETAILQRQKKRFLRYFGSFRTLQISLKAVFIVMLKIIYDNFEPLFLSITSRLTLMNLMRKKWQPMMADQHKPKSNERNNDGMEWLLCEPRTFCLISQSRHWLN